MTERGRVAGTGAWYIARQSGQHDGPHALDELLRRSRDGRLAADELVWKEGLDGWIPASSVAGLFAAQADAPPKPPPRSTTANLASAGAKVAASVNAAIGAVPIEKLNERAGHARFYRRIARASAIAAAVSLVGAVALAIFGYLFFFLSWAFLFACMFVASQGLATIIDRLDRIEASLDGRNPPL